MMDLTPAAAGAPESSNAVGGAMATRQATRLFLLRYLTGLAECRLQIRYTELSRNDGDIVDMTTA
jgi:uncharacterized damage-inducible protein DinB